MTKEQKKEIEKISKQFAEPFYETFGSINEGGWLIVDPLSGYLNSVGYEHELKQIPEKEGVHPQILILVFPDGSTFVPAGADLKPISASAENWIWINAK